MINTRKLSAALRSPGRCRGVEVPAVLDLSAELLFIKRQIIILEAIREVTDTFILSDGMITDSAREIRSAIAGIIRKYSNYTGFQIQLQTQYIRGADAHRNAFLSRVESVIGVDVSDLLKNRSTDMVVRNRMMASLRLIKGLDRYTVNKMTEAVLKRLKSGEGGIDIGLELAEAGKVTMSRAKLIARDQMGKLFSSLSQASQQDIGVTKYRWSTARDSRVRDRHISREGKIYYWKRPPAGGHPGKEVNCRCTAEPDLASSPVIQEMRMAA